MNLRLSMLVAALVLLFTPLTQAQTQGCNATVIDPAGAIHSPAIITSAARTLINQGADVHVVIVPSIQRYGSSLADVEREYETACPNWTTNGTRKANLFVVMVAPNDRQKNMFLGSFYAGAFDIPSTYSQLSNTYFKNRQWEMGLAAVLQGTTSQALSFRAQQAQAQQQRQQQRAYTGPGAAGAPIQETQEASTGDSHIGLWIFGFIVLALVGLTLFLLFRRGSEEQHYTPTTPSTPGTGYTTDPETTYPTRSYAATAGASPATTTPEMRVTHTTTIINNNPSNSGDGFVSGLVVGEMLSRPPQTVYVEQPAPTYVEPSTPTYIEPETTPAQAPDSTWEEPTQSQDTGFSNDTPSYDPPSSDFGGGSSGDSGF